MVRFNYAKLASTVDKYIGKLGQDGSLIDRDGVSIPAKFIVLEYNAQERDGELIQFTDQKVLLSPTVGEVPDAEEHRLVVQGERKRIVAVRPFAPAGIPVYYELQVRGG